MKLPVRPELFPGSVGRVVRTFEPHTEADPVAIAAQFLVAFGNALGRGPHVVVGETRHHMNEFLALVGQSSRSRKGDSSNVALRPVREADADWARNIGSGLSSGEGLIHAVRDPLEKINSKGERVLADEGVSDKRLLVVESEFSGALKQFSREGNVLSNVLRDAWDGKAVLRTLTRNSPLRATDAHISIIAHTTPEDLSAYLGDTEAANGLGNRFLFILTQRARLLPNPGRASEREIDLISADVRTALEAGRKVGELRRTAAADRLWERIYPELTQDFPGLIGKLLARSEAHVLRLSALFALLAQLQAIDVEHVETALAVWDYVDASTRIIFAQRTGDNTADRIKHELLPGQSMTLSEMREQIFANHISAARLQAAIKLLHALGEIKLERADTGGRPTVVVTRLDIESTSVDET